MKISKLAKIIVVVFAIVDLVFDIMAISITVWGVSSGLMDETTPFWRDLFASQGLFVGVLFFFVRNISPILLVLGAYFASPFIIKKISEVAAETRKERYWLSTLFSMFAFGLAVVLLLVIAYVDIPDGFHDLMVLLHPPF